MRLLPVFVCYLFMPRYTPDHYLASDDDSAFEELERSGHIDYMPPYDGSKQGDTAIRLLREAAALDHQGKYA